MNLPRLLKFLWKVRTGTAVDTYAVALILTESEFRKPLFRFFETMLAVFMILTQQRPRAITLGKCQVGLPYWQEKFGTGAWTLIKAILSDQSNYVVCCHYLSRLASRDIESVAIFYNGRPSALYVNRLKNNLALVGLAQRQLRSRPR